MIVVLPCVCAKIDSSMKAIEIVKAATEAFNQGRIDEALAFYDDAVVQRSPGSDNGLNFKIRHGKQALRHVLESDSHAQVCFHHRSYIGNENLVAVEGINSGIFDGVLVEQPVAIFYELKANKIISVTVYYDRLALREALDESCK